MLALFKKMNILAYFTAVFATFTVLSVIFPSAYSNSLGQKFYYYGIWGAKTAVDNYCTALIYSVLVATLIDLAIVIIFEFIVVKIHQKMVNVLYNKCDSQDFIKTYAPVFEKLKMKKVKRSPYILKVYLFYAQGLYEIGDTKNAIAVLNELTTNKGLNRKAGVHLKCLAYLNLLKYYYVDGRIEETDSCITIIESTCNRFITGSNSKYDKILMSYMQKATAINQFYQNEFSEVLDFYLDVIATSKTNYEYVLAYCYLAVILKSIGEDSNATEHLKFALQKGPHLFSVLETQQKLSAE